MFWSGNYIVVRELKCLLKEENVTLTQILEADDILQECKADNKALIQFLTRPEILAELITLITEEPPKNVELSSQYRHANIASEVLTSNLSMLRDRLSMDATQMNRLCDFVDRDPPLNPLLASYFSKTIEMLLERSPKQDWYLHHIVCLHVLDMFKSRRDFLPNLLRHISTSAICDTFKCFLHLGSPFNKIILEWLDEHQFLESLIQIICGTYDPEEALSARVVTQSDATDATRDQHDKLDSNHNAEPGDTAPTHTDAVTSGTKGAETNGEAEAPCSAAHAAEREARAERVRCVAASNAAALLCDIAADAATVDPFNNEWYAGRWIAARLRGEEAVRRLLQGVFTSPARARRHALVNACRLLLALLSAPPAPPDPADPADPAHAAHPANTANTAAPDSAEAREGSGAAERGAVERAVAPHLPLLHHALLHDAPRVHKPEAGGESGGSGGSAREAGAERVGAARVSVAELVARLTLSEVDDVPTALISLGTAGVLVDMMFRFPHNNFLHAQVCALVRNARANRRFSHRYTAHLIEECNLLTRLMDAFEENEDKKGGGVRAGYMGHVVAMLRSLDAAPPVLSSALQQRWDAFRDNKLRPLLQRHDTPLGGSYPWENNMYEMDTSIQVLMDNMADTLDDSYDFNETAASLEEGAEACEPLAEPLDAQERMDRMQQSAEKYFLDLNERHARFDDEMWDDPEPTPHALQQDSPWEGAGGGAGAGAGGCAGGASEEGWAQFDAFAEPAPADPFAPIDTPMMQPMTFWSHPESQEQSEFKRGSQNTRPGGGFEDDDKDALTLLLAQKMLTAFHSMAPTADPRQHYHPHHPLHPHHPHHPHTAPEDVRNEDAFEHLDRIPQSDTLEEITNVRNPQSDVNEGNPDDRIPQLDTPKEITNVRNPRSDVEEENPDERNSHPSAPLEIPNVQNSPPTVQEEISSVRNSQSKAPEGIRNVENSSTDVLEGVSDVQKPQSGDTSEILGEKVDPLNCQSMPSTRSPSVPSAPRDTPESPGSPEGAPPADR